MTAEGSVRRAWRSWLSAGWLPLLTIVFVAAGGLVSLSDATPVPTAVVWWVGLLVVGTPLVLQTAREVVSGRFAVDLVATLGSERLLTYIPYDLFIWAPIAAVIILGLRYSGIGRMIYAVGDNPVAARLGGVRVWQVQLFVYATCGVLSALGGILLVGFNNAADLGIGAPFLLPSVAAVVIGGTSIFGGSGGYVGTIFGALILTVLDSLLVILNASQATRQILYELIVLGLAAIYARTSSST